MTDHGPPGGDPLGLVARSHPLRALLAEEMHLRRLPRFAAPARFLQVVVLLEEDGGGASHAQIAALLDPAGPALPRSAKHALVALDPITLVWERHAEFATYGFLLPGPIPGGLDLAPFASIRSIIAEAPGRVIRATLAAILPAGSEQAGAELAAELFVAGGLVACDVAGGKARIWSDFRLQEDGVGRLVVTDRGLTGDEPAQLLQRLQELGNYRNMALLGLPVAQRLTPELGRLEQRLASLTTHVADPSSSDEPLLEELTRLSAELAEVLAETRYRMSATKAYAQIVEDRLASLEITPLPAHQSLADFTERRLTPAVRTCATVTERMEELSQRAARTSALLRTRIDTALARQTRDLLGSVDRRAHVQLRLQQAVEGFSVVAISYYLAGLLGYALKALPGERHDLLLAAAIPVILLAVGLSVMRFKRRLVEGAGAGTKKPPLH